MVIPYYLKSYFIKLSKCKNGFLLHVHTFVLK